MASGQERENSFGGGIEEGLSKRSIANRKDHFTKSTLIDHFQSKQAIIDKMKEVPQLKADQNDGKIRKSSLLSLSSQLNANLMIQNSPKFEPKQKKMKGDDKMPAPHLKRNEQMKSGFQMHDKEVKLDDGIKQKQIDYQNIVDSVVHANKEQENNLKELQKVLRSLQIKNEISSSEGIGSAGAFSTKEWNVQSYQGIKSSITSSANSSLFGIMQDNPNNVLLLNEKITQLQEQAEQVLVLTENEQEKVMEHEYKIMNIKKTSKGMREEINDLNQMNMKYEKQITTMTESILTINKETNHIIVNKVDTAKFLLQEELGNEQRISHYRESAEIHSTQIREELKIFNTCEDNSSKLEKKLEATSSVLENLEWKGQEILLKQEKQQDLIKEMDTFNVLANAFIYSQPSIDQEGQLSIDVDSLNKINGQKEEIKLNATGKSNSILLKEEIKKFEELHKNQFENVVDRLIALYKDLTSQHQTMETRGEDLLQQKNRLVNELHDNFEGEGGQEVRQRFQLSETLRREYKNLVLRQQQRDKSESAPSFLLEMRDIASMEQLVSKCFFFLTQTLFRLGRIMTSTRLLLQKASEEMSNPYDFKEGGILLDQIDSPEPTKKSFKLMEDENLSSTELLDYNNALFRQLEAILQFAGASKAILPQTRSQKDQQPRSTKIIQSGSQRNIQGGSSRNIPLISENTPQAQKGEILVKIYQEKFYGLPDVNQEFFEFLKNDFMVHYFCTPSNFSSYFSSLRLQADEKIKEFQEEQRKRGVQINYDIQDEDIIVIEKKKLQNELKEVVLETLFSRLEALRNEGQNNFKKVFGQGLEYISTLVNKSNQFSKDILSFLKLKLPAFLPPLSLSEQIIENEKLYFQKTNPNKKKKITPKTAPSSPAKSDWKDILITKKIQEMEEMKGVEQSKKQDDVRPQTSVSNNVQFCLSFDNNNQSPVDQDNVHFFEPEVEDSVEVEELAFMRGQRQETKITDANQLLQNTIIEKDFKNLNNNTRNKYTEVKKRDLKLSAESKAMWDSIKKYHKERTSQSLKLSRPSLPCISTVEIKVGFQTQRATLGLQKYILSSKKQNTYENLDVDSLEAQQQYRSNANNANDRKKRAQTQILRNNFRSMSQLTTNNGNQLNSSKSFANKSSSHSNYKHSNSSQFAESKKDRYDPPGISNFKQKMNSNEIISEGERTNKGDIFDANFEEYASKRQQHFKPLERCKSLSQQISPMKKRNSEFNELNEFSALDKILIGKQTSINNENNEDLSQIDIPLKIANNQFSKQYQLHRNIQKERSKILLPKQQKMLPIKSLAKDLASAKVDLIENTNRQRQLVLSMYKPHPILSSNKPIVQYEQHQNWNKQS